MGKYLQDTMLRFDDVIHPPAAVAKQCYLIAELFNIQLPKKVEIGGGIWRFIVFLTSDLNLDGRTREVGSCQDSYVFCDFEQLLSVDNMQRKELLLDMFIKGLKLCCDAHGYSFNLFEEIGRKVRANDIVFNDSYKERKYSRNKKLSAQIKGFISEDSKATYVSVFNETDAKVDEILLGNFDFRLCDRLQWVDDSKINIYKINTIQSYKRKKVADDYFTVNVESKTVKYTPITRENVFNYGVELLTQTDDYESALMLIHQAKELGHGKAENILLNLERNPDEREKAALLQTPKRSSK